MKIEATPEEIAALVVALQERQNPGQFAYESMPGEFLDGQITGTLSYPRGAP